jgi:hypothetical protein
MLIARGRHRSRGWQLGRRSVGCALVGAVLPLSLLGGLAQVSATAPAPDPLPAPGAPLSTWQAWSAQLAEQQARFPWRAMAAAAGCSFIESGTGFSSGAGPGSPIPADVPVPTGWALFHCPPGHGPFNSPSTRGAAPGASTTA